MKERPPQRKKRRPVLRQPAPEPELTCQQVLEEAILELFDLGRGNEMDEDEIDEVLLKLIDDRSAERRTSFKVLENESSS